jgi:hypothetical protein
LQLVQQGKRVQRRQAVQVLGQERLDDLFGRVLPARLEPCQNGARPLQHFSRDARELRDLEPVRLRRRTGEDLVVKGEPTRLLFSRDVKVARRAELALQGRQLEVVRGEQGVAAGAGLQMFGGGPGEG